MTSDEYIELMRSIQVGDTVSYYTSNNDYGEFTKPIECIVTEIKECETYSELDIDSNNSCYYCAGYIGVDGKTPKCLVYSDLDERPVDCRIFGLKKKDFIKADEFMI